MNETMKVRLKKRYTDMNFTGRIVEAGTEGEAYQFDILGDLWKVKVQGQAWGSGEITVRKENLEFLGEMKGTEETFLGLTDAELLVMLRETETIGAPEDEHWCRSVRQELKRRWMEKADFILEMAQGVGFDVDNNTKIVYVECMPEWVPPQPAGDLEAGALETIDMIPVGRFLFGYSERLNMLAVAVAKEV